MSRLLRALAHKLGIAGDVFLVSVVAGAGLTLGGVLVISALGAMAGAK